jgi:hypothetical protein
MLLFILRTLLYYTSRKYLSVEKENMPITGRTVMKTLFADGIIHQIGQI